MGDVVGEVVVAEAVGGEFELARSDVPVGRGQHVRGLAVGAGGEARLVALCGIQIRKEVWGSTARR